MTDTLLSAVPKQVARTIIAGVNTLISWKLGASLDSRRRRLSGLCLELCEWGLAPFSANGSGPRASGPEGPARGRGGTLPVTASPPADLPGAQVMLCSITYSKKS